MKIHVRFIDDDTVHVALVPNRIAQWFGARPRVGIAIRQHKHSGEKVWRWKTTEKPVPSNIESEIECGVVIPTPLPPMRIRLPADSPLVS